ncbi:putative nuclease HARBI1 [Anopheles funestus]|uniref:putative nuclease HARBI1 n=1 Tax=Anopheles funestus TaxID=62324 RepID=UPI0020C73AC7|nr:putative nuclease HARBI1 [Anopheles funestus]
MISAYYVSDSDSSEEEAKENFAAYRRALRVSSDPLQLPNKQFLKNFRISKEIFTEILEEIAPKFPPVHSSGMTIKQKLAATLRFLADGSYQNGVGNDFNVAVAQSTFSTILNQTLKILEESLCPKWITLEMNSEEQQAARCYFFRKSSIPGVVMCADGTHVKIIAPKNDKDQFYNRKGFYSMNVLVVSIKI